MLVVDRDELWRRSDDRMMLDRLYIYFRYWAQTLRGFEDV